MAAVKGGTAASHKYEKQQWETARLASSHGTHRTGTRQLPGEGSCQLASAGSGAAGDAAGTRRSTVHCMPFAVWMVAPVAMPTCSRQRREGKGSRRHIRKQAVRYDAPSLQLQPSSTALGAG